MRPDTLAVFQCQVLKNGLVFPEGTPFKFGHRTNAGPPSAAEPPSQSLPGQPGRGTDWWSRFSALCKLERGEGRHHAGLQRMQVHTSTDFWITVADKKAVSEREEKEEEGKKRKMSSVLMAHLCQSIHYLLSSQNDQEQRLSQTCLAGLATRAGSWNHFMASTELHQCCGLKQCYLVPNPDAKCIISADNKLKWLHGSIKKIILLWKETYIFYFKRPPEISWHILKLYNDL